MAWEAPPSFIPPPLLQPLFPSMQPPSPDFPPFSRSPTRHGNTKEGFGLVALWWMHFHRPISVILEKQVLDSILSGFAVFSLPLNPPWLSSFFPLFSFHPSRHLHHIFEGYSLMLVSADADPSTRTLKAQAFLYPACVPQTVDSPKVKDWMTSHPPKQWEAHLSPTCPFSDWLSVQQHLWVNQFNSFNADWPILRIHLVDSNFPQNQTIA